MQSWHIHLPRPWRPIPSNKMKMAYPAYPTHTTPTPSEGFPLLPQVQYQACTSILHGLLPPPLNLKCRPIRAGPAPFAPLFSPWCTPPPSFASTSASFLLLLLLPTALVRSCDQGRELHLLSISNLYYLICLLLFDMIVLYCSLYSILLTLLRFSCSGLIYLHRSSCSVPLRYYCSTLFCLVFQLLNLLFCYLIFASSSDLLYPLWSPINCDWYAHAPLCLIWSTLLCLLLLWTF